ncbi:MAG: fibronectin type III domain-containing protein [Patescibacteria group bacterium]|nr:fibronectin type III domain-containing protein [Patescibacteria group bacterium]MDE2015502.1 fibronectin type III domain-containing protein [Patescibacteria group bacterium]MDE2226882.1 fibronectin type III domain-containing protein [Patescibacteria group bacterium]
MKLDDKILLFVFLPAFFIAFPLLSAYAATPTYAPGVITLNVINSSEIDLSWPGVIADPAVTGYKIERESPVGGGFTTIVADTGSVVSYQDTNLAPGTTYSYRISAINSDGTGPVSANQAYAATYPAPAIAYLPNIPQNLSAIPISISKIELSWSAALSTDSVTGYRVERNGGTIVSNTNSADTAYTDTNLIPGVTYDYRVYAINSAGTGNPSQHVFTIIPPLPSAPQSVKAIAGDGQVTVSWSPAYVNIGSLTGYIVTSSASSSLTVGSSTLSAIIDGLTNGVSYLFSVSAINVSGNGPAAFTNSVVPMSGATSSAQTSATDLSTTTSISTTSSSSSSPQADSASLQEQIQSLTALLQQLMAQVQEKQLSSAAATSVNATSSTDSGSAVVQPSPSVSGFSRNLTLGSSGADVAELQKFLVGQDIGSAARNLGVAGNTGYFGLLTQKALSEYQGSVGIDPPAGYFGPKTRSYINIIKTQ